MFVIFPPWFFAILTDIFNGCQNLSSSLDSVCTDAVHIHKWIYPAAFPKGLGIREKDMWSRD